MGERSQGFLYLELFQIEIFIIQLKLTTMNDFVGKVFFTYYANIVNIEKKFGGIISQVNFANEK